MEMCDNDIEDLFFVCARPFICGCIAALPVFAINFIYILHFKGMKVFQFFSKNNFKSV